MENISIASIIVEGRFRHDMGDIAGLAQSINELGQLQPIIINKDRRLIAGGRRLAAMKSLGKELIAASVFDLDDIDALKVERDENDQRKTPTVSERVALAEAVSERIGGRQLANLKQNRGGNISTSDEAGKTRDIAASKAGFGSGKTLEAAQKVIERGTPALIEAMDAGKMTINAARNISLLSNEEQGAVDFNDKTAIKNASSMADARARRERERDAKKEVAQAPNAAPKPDESRLYQEGSSISAFVLASRAVHAITQISKKDPNAIAAIDDIRATLEKQFNLITR